MSGRLFVGIDLQVGFLTDAIKQTDYCARVEEFLSAQDKNRVVLTRFVNKPHSNFEKLMDWPDMQPGDGATALFGGLESGGYPVIEKSTYTSWLPAVRDKAAALGAKEIVLFGLDSDACVFKTALDVFETEFMPVILADLCQSSGGKERHEAGLMLLRALIGERQVITSDMMPARA